MSQLTFPKHTQELEGHGPPKKVQEQLQSGLGQLCPALSPSRQRLGSGTDTKAMGGAPRATPQDRAGLCWAPAPLPPAAFQPHSAAAQGLLLSLAIPAGSHCNHLKAHQTPLLHQRNPKSSEDPQLLVCNADFPHLTTYLLVS